jgi:hypothetical protein
LNSRFIKTMFLFGTETKQLKDNEKEGKDDL